MNKDKINSLRILSYGNIVEYYDFAIYGFLAPVIGKNFSSFEDEVTATIFGYFLLAIGYLARPFGGLVYGYIGDKINRQKALSLSLITMTFPCLIISILPTYKQIGWIAPVILIIARFIQVFSVGGEFCTSLVIGLENNKENKHSWVAAIITAAGMVGWVIGAITVTSCTKLLPTLFAWRIPFVIGFVVSVIMAYNRYKLYKQHSESCKPTKPKITFSYIKNIANQQKIEFLLCLLAAGLIGSMFYSFFIFPNGYLVITTKMTLNEAMFYTTFGMCLYLVLLPIAGLIANKLKKEIALLFFALFTIPLTIIIFFVMAKGNKFLYLSMTLSAILMSFLMSLAPAFIVKLFKTEVRLSLFSVSYNLGNSLLGGIAPFVLMALYSFTKNNLSPAIYVITCTLMFAFVLKLLIKKRLISLNKGELNPCY